MPRPSIPAALASVASLLVLAAAARAEPAAPPTSRTEVRAAELPGGGVARLVVEVADLDESCSARVALGGAAPVTLHDGLTAATLAVGHDALLVAYEVDDRRSPFRVRVARREGGRVSLGPATSIVRPGGRADLPFAVAATPVPDGFAVFFQEVQSDDPSAAHTYLVRLDALGAPRGPAREVRVPWALAAAAWNGHGFHLALYYPGDARGMRLSMVSLTEDGTPEQHPDWASGAGYIGDVHLVAAGGSIRAYYRGGSGGDRLLESDVTAIGAWGREPPAARDHGALPFDSAIVLGRRGAEVRPRALALH